MSRPKPNRTLDDFISWLKEDPNNLENQMLSVLNELPKEKQLELWNNFELLEAFNWSGLANLSDSECYEEGLDCLDYIEECGFDAEKHWNLAWNMYMFQAPTSSIDKLNFVRKYSI